MLQRSWCFEPRWNFCTLSCLLVSVFVLMAPTSAISGVTVYSGSDCPVSGLKKTYNHAWPWDLSTQYYDGTTVTLNNSISSIKIDGDWEVLTCNTAGFVQCAAQLNTEKQVDGTGEPLYEGTCINLSSTSWSSTNPIPPNNAISSLLVQPNDFDAYWSNYTYREDSSHPSGRYGYVELFTDVNYTGIGYKIYSSDYDLSNTPVHSGVHSIKFHGNLISRLCLEEGDSCASNILVNEDQAALPVVPVGIENLVASKSSATVMASADSSEQASDFAHAFLNWGSDYRRDSFFQWAEYGPGTTHVVYWPSDDCYETCNAGDECTVDPICQEACEHNMCAYMEHLNRAGYRWAGDSSLVFLDGHGSFHNSPSGPYASISMTHRGCCNYSLNQFRSSLDEPWVNCPYEWTSVAEGSSWGEFNTDWVVTTACNSLGDSSVVTLVTDGGSFEDSLIPMAWKSLLLSGVHGIGGYYNDSYWRPLAWDDTGDELADDFWSDLVTKSFAQAWGETSENFIGLDIEDRVVYYMVACPPTYTVAQCVARMDSDYYHGYQTGPQPDLEDYNDLRFHIEVYEP